MYKLIYNYLAQQVNSVQNLETTACIPFDPANTDYQAYLAWLEKGNEPLQPDNNQ